jgi:hypothetical protein
MISQTNSDSLFSPKIFALAEKAMYAQKQNLHDRNLQLLCKLGKAEAMVWMLRKSEMDSTSWELKVSILTIELMENGIYSDSSAIAYISRLVPQICSSSQID